MPGQPLVTSLADMLNMIGETADRNQYQCMTTIAGRMCEFTTYGKAIRLNRIIEPRKKAVDKVDDVEEETQDLYAAGNLVKKTKKFKLVSLSNYNNWHHERYKLHSKFLTLTYRENMTDRNRLLMDWEAFCVAVKRLPEFEKMGASLKYLSVIEIQKRGALHLHAGLFNMPYIPVAKLQKIWPHGFIKVNAIGGFKQVHRYLVKYFTKSMQDRSLKNTKAYFSSKQLKQPLHYRTMTTGELHHRLRSIKIRLIQKFSYESQYQDVTKVWRFDIGSNNVYNDICSVNQDIETTLDYSYMDNDSGKLVYLNPQNGILH